MKRKVLVFILAAAMAVSMTACSSAGAPEQAESAQTTQDDEMAAKMNDQFAAQSAAETMKANNANASVAASKGTTVSSGGTNSSSSAKTAGTSKTTSAGSSESSGKKIIAGGSSDTASSTEHTHIEGKEEKDGFDESTNRDEEMAGITFSMPEYFEGPDSAISSIDNKYYYAETGSETISMIYLMSEEVEGATIEEFTVAMDQIEENVLDGFDEVELVSSTDCQLAGITARRVEFTSEINGKPYYCITVFTYNEDTENVVYVALAQTDATEYCYISDLEKILDSATKE